MKKTLVILSSLMFLMSSCSKEVNSPDPDSPEANGPIQEPKQFVEYNIGFGMQSSDKSTYLKTSYSEMKFVVKFDSSAIYKTIEPHNQKDINKLFGFSDNNSQHHQFSARFGWRWSDNALRLFAYTYNNGTRGFKELGTVEIGTEVNCAIKVAGDSYLFTMNDKEVPMPRATVSAKAEGYKLFPYFGGDESAPHKITIRIKEL